MLTHVTICIHICTFPRIDIYVYIHKYVHIYRFIHTLARSSTHMHCILHACVHAHIYKHIHSHICAQIQDNHINTLICLGTRELTHLLKHSYTHLIILLKLYQQHSKDST